MTSNHFPVKKRNLNPPYALLEDEEHHHLSRVLRIEPGKEVWLVDKEGSSYKAQVEEVGRHQTRLRIIEKKTPQTRRLRLSLAQALIKPKKMDLVIQKATELGASFIIPVEADRSVVKLGEKKAGRLQRWHKIAEEAAKQSRRQDIPIILAPQPFASFLRARNEDRRLVLCEDGGVRLKDILLSAPSGAEAAEVLSVIALVGPEGGWTQKEKGLALESGFEAVSLGSCVLRSETAALAVLAALSIFWGE